MTPLSRRDLLAASAAALALAGCNASARSGRRGPAREVFGPVRRLGIVSVLEDQITVIENEPLRGVPRRRVLPMPGWNLDARATVLAANLLAEREPDLTVVPLTYEPLQMRRIYPLPSERGFEFSNPDRIIPFLRRTFAAADIDGALLITREQLDPDFLRKGWYEGATLYRPLPFRPGRLRAELPAVALRVRIIRSTTLSAKSGATALVRGQAAVDPPWAEPLNGALGPRDWGLLQAVFDPLIAEALEQAIGELKIQDPGADRLGA